MESLRLAKKYVTQLCTEKLDANYTNFDLKRVLGLLGDQVVMNMQAVSTS
jgi:hypothetical protein